LTWEKHGKADPLGWDPWEAPQKGSGAHPGGFGGHRLEQAKLQRQWGNEETCGFEATADSTTMVSHYRDATVTQNRNGRESHVHSRETACTPLMIGL